MFSLASTPRRPRVASSQSFTRLDKAADEPSLSTRHRANTVHTPTITSVPEAKQLRLAPGDGGAPSSGDIFESPADDEDGDVDISAGTGLPSQADHTDELPIEIQSSSERFLKSLSVKSHAAPLSIESIADLFQDYYVQAETQIATHIAALSTRISREKSPTPSVSSRASGAGKGRQRSVPGSEDLETGEQQMLTATEIANKRKTRRLLELQRNALEEAVERRVCERVYDRVYRHRSTDDEVRDAKLRSKTAALSLIGVGLKELHVNVPLPPDGDEKRLQEEIYDRLGSARAELQLMDQERCPLGKLQHLILVHQSIVETLAHVFPSTSSADEVLPTLIYTLVTSPPETMNIASNLHFIQLFRAASKMDGEAAYCLVNLEAAISFLETVDLSSLRTDGTESFASEGPSASATPSKQGASTRSHRITSLTADLPAVSNPDGSAVVSGRSSPVPESTATAVRPGSGKQQRRLSHMLQAQAERIEARRDNLLQSADQAFDSINSTLENSFKFVFGRLREQETDAQGAPVIIPKTLDDARRLVMSPTQEQADDALLASELSLGTPAEDSSRRASASSGIASRLAARDGSVDSSRSGGSVNRKTDDKPVAGPAEAMGNFVNSLNPLSRFGVPSFPKFGRGPNSPISEQMTPKGVPQNRSRSTSINQDAESPAADALAQLKKAKPPIKRFLEVKDARQLRLGEIEDLLKDYRRLAELLGEAITS